MTTDQTTAAAPAVLEHTDPAIVELVDQAERYAEAATAENTRRAYRSRWATWQAWADHRGFATLPADPAVVAMFAANLAAGGHKASTVAAIVSAINCAHREHGHEAPGSSQTVRTVLRGIRRQHGTAPRQARPVLAEDLRAMVASLEDRRQVGRGFAERSIPAGLIGLRDRALLLLGWSGAFRRAELVALQVADLEHTAQGVLVHVRRSKTDQDGAGQTVAIPRSRTADVCPVEAVAAWLAAASIKSGPLFRGINRHGKVAETALSGRAVANIVQRSAKGAGLDADRMSGHSLRAGLATSAAIAGKSERSIMRTTRHTSVAMVRRYVRDADAWRDNAAEGLL